MKVRNIRHGDMALIAIDAIPKVLEDLLPSESKVLLVGRNGNAHSFTNGTFYDDEDGQVVGYLVAEPGCKLLHRDHGSETGGTLREAEIPPLIYQVRRQAEETHEGMRPVED
jgi:hypothetical protein